MNQNELLKMISAFGNGNSNVNADKIISGLDNNKKKELNDIMSDKSKVNEILNSPAAQNIIRKLNGK